MIWCSIDRGEPIVASCTVVFWSMATGEWNCKHTTSDAAADAIAWRSNERLEERWRSPDRPPLLCCLVRHGRDRHRSDSAGADRRVVCCAVGRRTRRELDVTARPNGRWREKQLEFGMALPRNQESDE